jgi:hypothetical protein
MCRSRDSSRARGRRQAHMVENLLMASMRAALAGELQQACMHNGIAEQLVRPSMCRPCCVLCANGCCCFCS